MPFTFLAHQGPVLPLVRRGSQRWDGVALVAGSVAPDLAYVTRGWGYGPWGIALWFDGHRPMNLLVVALVASLLAWVVRRWILPVLPLALPDGGPFHFRDYRFLADVRHRWRITFVSALFGAVTHLVLDAFTHDNGAVVSSSGLLETELFDVGSRTVRIYSALQYGGTVVLSAYAIWCLWQIGVERRFLPAGRSPAATSERLPGPVVGAFWAFVAGSCVVAVAYAQTRSGYHYALNREFYGSTSVVIISWCWVAFIGLTLACLAAEPFAHRARSDVTAERGGSVAA